MDYIPVSPSTSQNLAQLFLLLLLIQCYLLTQQKKNNFRLRHRSLNDLTNNNKIFIYFIFFFGSLFIIKKIKLIQVE